MKRNQVVPFAIALVLHRYSEVLEPGLISRVLATEMLAALLKGDIQILVPDRDISAAPSGHYWILGGLAPTITRVFSAYLRPYPMKHI
jgi:hypothetical protein